MPAERLRPVLHLVSDSTGETAAAAAAAVLSQFDGVDPQRRTHVFVRSAAGVDDVLGRIAAEPGLTVYTLLDPALAERLERGCADLGQRAVALLDPFFEAISAETGAGRAHRPGRQHVLGAGYFDRVAAIDFAMTQDDGASTDRLSRAQVILVGPSRTSKTPTCLYLAVRGIRAANVPLVPRRPPPAALEQAIARGALAIGLTASPTRLRQVRSERLETLGAPFAGQAPRGEDYADPSAISAELAEARLLFDRLGLPVIDVTRRSIEETAASILALMRDKGLDP